LAKRWVVLHLNWTSPASVVTRHVLSEFDFLFWIFRAIEQRENQFFVLRGHEVQDVEDTIAEHDGFLLVSKRGAGAEFVKGHS
jgi:hypothetical protein